MFLMNLFVIERMHWENLVIHFMGFLLTAPDSPRRKRFSAIGIITAAALLDAYVVGGTVDGDIFYGFVHLLSYPNWCCLMALTKSLLSSLTGVPSTIYKTLSFTLWVLLSSFYLPTPDLMPIEECLSSSWKNVRVQWYWNTYKSSIFVHT